MEGCETVRRSPSTDLCGFGSSHATICLSSPRVVLLIETDWTNLTRSVDPCRPASVENVQKKPEISDFWRVFAAFCGVFEGLEWTCGCSFGTRFLRRGGEFPGACQGLRLSYGPSAPAFWQTVRSLGTGTSRLSPGFATWTVAPSDPDFGDGQAGLLESGKVSSFPGFRQVSEVSWFPNVFRQTVGLEFR